MEIVTRQTPNAANSTQQLSELVNIVKAMMPAPSGGFSFDGLMGFLSSPMIAPLIQRVLTPPDPLGELAKIKSAMELLDGMRGGGDGKPKDWRAMLAEGAIQKAPEILQGLRELSEANVKAAVEKRAAADATRLTVEAIRGLPTPAGAVDSTVAEPRPPASVMPVGPLRTVPLTEQPPAAAGPAAPAPVPMQNIPQNVRDQAVGDFAMMRIVQMIAEGRDAEDVVDFLDEIDPTVNDALAGNPPDVVTTFLAGQPIICEATRLPGWNAFLTKAQTYIKEIRAEDKAAEAAAARAVPV
jgi:hypothetical protein